MYPFPQSVNPAVRSHFDAQTAFMNELSQTMSRAVQQVFQLNLQLGQSIFQDVAGTTQRMLAAGRPADALSAAAAGAQPGTDKLRAYQQQLSQLAAATQVDLSRVTEQHVQETSRTARALADDVTRAATEETEKNVRRQEESIKNSRDAFMQAAERGGRFQEQDNLHASANGAGGKPDGQAGSPDFAGNAQGGSTQAGYRHPSSPR
jgi:phasin family protein